MLRGCNKRIVALACYIPPNYNIQRGRGCMEFIGSIVMEMKRRYNDPLVVVAGDFNSGELKNICQTSPM